MLLTRRGILEQLYREAWQLRGGGAPLLTQGLLGDPGREHRSSSAVRRHGGIDWFVSHARHGGEQAGSRYRPPSGVQGRAARAHPPPRARGTSFFDAPVFGPFGQVSQVLADCLDMIFAPTMLERSRISTIYRLVLLRNFGPRLPLVNVLFESGNHGDGGWMRVPGHVPWLHYEKQH